MKRGDLISRAKEIQRSIDSIALSFSLLLSLLLLLQSGSESEEQNGAVKIAGLFLFTGPGYTYYIRDLGSVH